MADLVMYPASRCARKRRGMNAERFASGGYLERICLTSFGWVFSRLIDQYLRERYQWKQGWQRGQPRDDPSRSLAKPRGCQRRVCACEYDAAWGRRHLRDIHPVPRVVTRQHYKRSLSAQGKLLSIT